MDNSTLNNSSDKYEAITYRSQDAADRDIRNREAEGWEVVSVTQSGGFSGGCVGCLGFIPIVIPLGSKPKIKVTYRKPRE
jgi:hypothetical protein